MAASFGPDTPILSYGPRAHADPGGRNDRIWLYWPAWAFRVVAPELRRRRFNVLQKAVLGVLRASRLTAVELSERLGVHPELAAFVVTELQEQGRVDAQWTVTRRGIELLDEEYEESGSLVPGWVFGDPWNGNLWPFVASSQEHARTVQGETDYPVLDLGTTGRPWRQPAWMQRPPDGREAEPPVPDAREILRAALRHKRLERRSRHVEAWEDEDSDAAVAAGIDLKRVSGIEPEPEPVFLVSFLYVPRNGGDSDLDWHACDFFGRENDPELRRLVARVADDEPHLARRLDWLLGRTLHGSFDEYRQTARNRRHRARRLLERALTLDVRNHGVAEPLAEALEGWLELRDLEDAAGQWKRRSVLTCCRTVLERLFREIANAWPLAGMADRLSRGDWAMNVAVLQAAARDIGLTEPPDAMCRVQHGQIRAVSDYGDNWRLRPLVVATLLRARDEVDHPLRSAARNAPDLLGRIECVTIYVGAAAHDSEDGEFEPDAVDTSVQETLEIVGLLLNLPVRPIKEILRDVQEDSP